MSLEPPKLKSGSVEEFMSICDGSFFPSGAGNDPKYVGAFAKFVGALWMSSMARKTPHVRSSISPCHKRLFVGTLLNILSCCGKAHSLQVGAKRYVDALLEHSTYNSGVFYGSRKGLSGEVSNQADFLSYFTNEIFQDNANEAIHEFIKNDKLN